MWPEKMSGGESSEISCGVEKLRALVSEEMESSWEEKEDAGVFNETE